MDKLLTVSDIAARYKICEATARNYMRQMIHMERPLAVKEWAVRAWEDARTVEPQVKKKAAVRPLKTPPQDEWRIPRRRA